MSSFNFTQIIIKLGTKLTPLITRLNPKFAITIYSLARRDIMHRLYVKQTPKIIVNNSSHSKILWGIEFRNPIFNGVGMFKNGECLIW